MDQMKELKERLSPPLFHFLEPLRRKELPETRRDQRKIEVEVE
jgi:hypothetical protein